MARNIFIVNAMIVDANGTYHNLDGYPKTFDSKNYQDDVDKAYRRADGDMSETWGAMCKVDTRMMQTVTLSTISGDLLSKKAMGSLGESEEV